VPPQGLDVVMVDERSVHRELLRGGEDGALARGGLGANFERARIRTGRRAMDRDLDRRRSPMARSVFQADERERGGRNTALPHRTGRRGLLSVEREEEPIAAGSGIDPHQDQESTRPSNTPAGTEGAAGCPEHHAPEQGREGGGTGSGRAPDGSAKPPDRSCSKGSISEESRSGSDRDVTRWEQPACTPEGADNTSARSDATAPVGRGASFPEWKSLIIRRTDGADIPASRAEGINGQDGNKSRNVRYTRSNPFSSTSSFFRQSMPGRLPERTGCAWGHRRRDPWLVRRLNRI
jgi:hypothetical protein